MPAMNGFDLLRRLRVRAPETPVILMLDGLDNQTLVRGMELGAIQSLVKPITAELLAETAAYAVRLYRSRRNVSARPLDYHSKRTGAASISATKAKNEFAGLLEKVIQGGAVVITKHDAPKATPVSRQMMITGRFPRSPSSDLS
jgi:prevent-host-death family protein